MDQTTVYHMLTTSPHLPVVPPAISHIFRMLRRPDQLDVDELARMIAREPQLNQAVLAHVNSGYYQVSRKINGINEAIVLIGLKTARNLIIYFLTDLLFANKIGAAYASHLYWKHNLGTAVACTMLAEALGHDDKFQLFSYGLLHDIGFAAISFCLPEIVEQVYASMKRGVHQVVAEKVALAGLTHADIGAWLCERWGLPGDIRRVVQYHHSPLLADGDTAAIKIIHIADHVSTEYYEKLLNLQISLPPNLRIMQEIGATPAMLEDIGKRLPAAVDAIAPLFML